MNFKHFFSSKSINSNLLLVAIFIVTCNNIIAIPFIKSRIEKANEALIIYDYFKAKKLFYKSINVNKVEACYGLAVIYSRTDNPFTHIDSALINIKKSKNNLYLLKTNSKKSLKNKEVYIRKVDSLFSKIDSVLFAVASIENTIFSYKNYQNKYSDKKYLKSIENHITTSKFNCGNLLFAEALQQKKSESITELSNICDSNFCIFNSEIQNKIPQILIELQFLEMTKFRSIQAYNEFRIKHPKSIYESSVDDSIFALSTTLKAEKSYYDFIKANPQNKNVFQAWQLIYNSASNDNSPNFFKHFLERYPEYPYIENVAKEYKLSQTTFYKIKHEKYFGFCDASGNELLKPSYEYLDEFSEGLCVAIQNGKSGYIGRNGTPIIPFIYDEAEKFIGGLAIVKKDNQFHIINKKNEIIYSTKLEINDFSEGLTVAKKDDKYGYLNEKGNWEINPDFDNAYDFKNGFAVAEKNGKVGLINKSGIAIINFEYEWIDVFYGNIFRLQTEEKFKLLNIVENKFILEDVDFVDVLSDGLAAFYKDEKVGYIDSTGSTIIAPQFDLNEESKSMQQFSNGYALVQLKNRTFLIDKTGKKVLNQNYESMRKPSDGLIAVKKKNKWGFVDTKNELKIKYQYSEASSFNDGLAIVKFKNSHLLIDTKSNIKIKLKKQKIQFLGYELLIIESDKHKNLSDKNLVTLISDIDEIKPYKENIFSIEKAGKLAYYNVIEKKIIWKEDGFAAN